jgi:hypothetical protein
MAASLVCPACGARHPAQERFCAACGTPLVHAPRPGGEPPLSEASERARKVRPQYSEGPLVRVAAARNQPEAELLQGLLLEEGVPSLVRRSGGFDVPDFLASGPRDVLVPESGAEAARDILRPAWAERPPAAPASGSSRAKPWVRALAVAMAVLIVALVAAGLFAAMTP